MGRSMAETIVKRLLSKLNQFFDVQPHVGIDFEIAQRPVKGAGFVQKRIIERPTLDRASENCQFPTT